jgi:Spo0E like sporulation regulatory protein
MINLKVLKTITLKLLHIIIFLHKAVLNVLLKFKTPSDNTVLNLSQKLDKYIVKYQAEELYYRNDKEAA